MTNSSSISKKFQHGNIKALVRRNCFDSIYTNGKTPRKKRIIMSSFKNVFCDKISSFGLMTFYFGCGRQKKIWATHTRVANYTFSRCSKYLEWAFATKCDVRDDLGVMKKRPPAVRIFISLHIIAKSGRGHEFHQISTTRIAKCFLL